MLEQLAQRRHRLAGARGGVLRAARHHAVHEAHPPARAGDRRPARLAGGCSSRAAPSTAVAHTRRDAPARERRRPLQHPQHRHLPVAAAAAPADGAAAGRRPGDASGRKFRVNPLGADLQLFRRARDRGRHQPSRRADQRARAAVGAADGAGRAGGAGQHGAGAGRACSTTTTAPAKAWCCCAPAIRRRRCPSSDDPHLRPARHPRRRRQRHRLEPRGGGARRHHRRRSRARPRAAGRGRPTDRCWRPSTTARRARSAAANTSARPQGDELARSQQTVGDGGAAAAASSTPLPPAAGC